MHLSAHSKTDQALVNCGCGECKSELAYRDVIRRQGLRPAEVQLELFPSGETFSAAPDPAAYEDIPARKYSG